MAPIDVGGLTPAQAEERICRDIIGRNLEHDFDPKLSRVRDACAPMGCAPDCSRPRT